MFTVCIPSPIGLLEIRSTDSAVSSIRFIDGEAEALPTAAPSALLQQCITELQEYFDGQRREFSFPMQQSGTGFQQKVWALLSTIPYGKTISYRNLALRLGDVKAIRAVGTTNGKNNLAIVVPCHRVIGSNQELTGYAGGLWRKQWLLEHEARYSQGVQQLSLL